MSNVKLFPRQVVFPEVEAFLKWLDEQTPAVRKRALDLVEREYCSACGKQPSFNTTFSRACIH